MVFRGFGFQNLLKFDDFHSKYRFQNRSKFGLCFLLKFVPVWEHFWSHFGSFLDNFWRLGVTLGDFWETLGLLWLQLGGLGRSLVALGFHFGLRNWFWSVLVRFWAYRLDDMHYLLFGLSFSRSNIDIVPNKIASRLHDTRFVLCQS